MPCLKEGVMLYLNQNVARFHAEDATRASRNQVGGNDTAHETIFGCLMIASRKTGKQATPWGKQFEEHQSMMNGLGWPQYTLKSLTNSIDSGRTHFSSTDQPKTELDREAPSSSRQGIRSSNKTL